MTTETRTEGFWVSTTGRYACDIINDGHTDVQNAFMNGVFLDEFEEFVRVKMAERINAWEFMMNRGDFNSEFEDWETEFIDKKTDEIFVEGKDAQFLGATYHWETATLPADMSFWEFMDAHESEYHDKYKDDMKMMVPVVGEEIHFDGMTSKVSETFPNVNMMRYAGYKIDNRRDCGFYIGTLVVFEDYKPVRKVAVAPLE